MDGWTIDDEQSDLKNVFCTHHFEHPFDQYNFPLKKRM